MGYSGGTDVFDRVAGLVLRWVAVDSYVAEEILYTLMDVLEDKDWDTQSESDYFEHPVVQKVWKRLHYDED